MSDASNHFQITFDQSRAILTRQKLVSGARLRLSGIKYGFLNRNYKIRVGCNQGYQMGDGEVKTTITIEIGKEGDETYSKHEYATIFKEGHQEEIFDLTDGEVLRDGFLGSESFDDSVFDVLNYQFRVTATVHSVKGLRMLPLVMAPYTDPQSQHDKVLIVGHMKFYVLSQIISLHSRFFLKLFSSDFAESKKDEIEIRDVSCYDFQSMLKTLYPLAPAITWEKVGTLLRMADRFDIPALTQKCIDYLSCSEDESLVEKNVFSVMKWAEEYQLLELQNVASKTLEGMVSLHAHIKENEAEFKELPVTVRERILYALYLRGEKK